MRNTPKKLDNKPEESKESLFLDGFLSAYGIGFIIVCVVSTCTMAYLRYDQKNEAKKHMVERNSIQSPDPWKNIKVPLGVEIPIYYLTLNGDVFRIVQIPILNNNGIKVSIKKKNGYEYRTYTFYKRNLCNLSSSNRGRLKVITETKERYLIKYINEKDERTETRFRKHCPPGTFLMLRKYTVKKIFYDFKPSYERRKKVEKFITE